MCSPPGDQRDFAAAATLATTVAVATHLVDTQKHQDKRDQNPHWITLRADGLNFGCHDRHPRSIVYSHSSQFEEPFSFKSQPLHIPKRRNAAKVDIAFSNVIKVVMSAISIDLTSREERRIVESSSRGK
jgi:hypothetical protein